MNLGEAGTLTLGFYLVAMLVVAEFARRRRESGSPSDHFLANRGLGVFVLFLTLYATAYSGNSLVGYPGKAYRSGYSFIMATGFMMSILVVFHSLVPKLRPVSVTRRFVTPGDWVRYRFASDGETAAREDPDAWAARALVRCVGALMTIALANFLLAQLKAMGQVTSLVTDGRITFEQGVVGLAILILFYETRGGMRAVAWTDAAQGILMLFGLGALLSWLLVDAGGIGAVTAAVAEVRPEAVRVPDATVCVNWFSTTLLLGLASVLYPQAIQRIYAAQNGRALKLSFALMSFMPLVTTLVVTLIGVAAIPRIAAAGVATDGVLPLLLGQWGGSGEAATLGALLVFIGALAAIMSTADSCLLSLGSLVVRDLFNQSDTDPRTTRMGKLFAAGILFAMVPIALREDLTLWRLIELKMELLIQCVPAFLVAIHWPRQTALPTLVGLVIGTLFSVGLTLYGIPRLWGFHVGVVGLVLNLAVVLSWSGFRPGQFADAGHAQ